MPSTAANLLPNASFELDFGDIVPTNWGDTQNELSLKVQATGQTPNVWPSSEAAGDAVDGERVGRVETEAADDGAAGHLLSPMINVQSCTPHTISVYAKCDDPSAKLEIGLWARPVDLMQTPSSLSHSLALTGQWQRYEFTCSTDELEDRVVVDFKVTSAEPGAVVWFDAAQLEQGPEATPFAPRRVVEAAVAGRRARLTHLSNTPLELYLTTYNHADRPRNVPITLQITQLADGRPVFCHTVTDPVAPGRNERTLALPFPFIGEFRARLLAGSGEQISPEDYMFVNYPVFDESLQAVVYAKHSAVHEVPAERSVLPWVNDRNWYSDSQPTLIVTKDDAIYSQMSDGHTVICTRDGGRSWENLQVTKVMNTVLHDGTFLGVEPDSGDDSLSILRSADEGRTWHPLGRIEQARHPQVGPIEQLHDGSLIMPCGICVRAAAGPDTVYAFRSSDGGQTWSTGSPITPGGEPQILELQSGRLLAFCRNNPTVPPDDLQRPFRNEGPWRLWQRFCAQRGLASYTKRVTIAASDDGGCTWHRQRPATTYLEEMHGGGIQLPDGRVVFLYTHRGPWVRGGERAKVSEDEGRTWRDEIYFMTATPSYPGYSGNCVLPPHLGDGKPGMILSLVGERSEGNWGSEGPATSEGFKYMPRVQAIRWRPID